MRFNFFLIHLKNIFQLCLIAGFISSCVVLFLKDLNETTYDFFFDTLSIFNLGMSTNCDKQFDQLTQLESSISIWYHDVYTHLSSC